MKIAGKVSLVVAGAALGLGAVWLYRSASADGPPSTTPLVYSGRLSQDGTPVADGSYPITILVWKDPTSLLAADRVCTTIPGSTLVVGGRFQVALDAACRTAVETDPELWVEVVVSGTSLGRSKINAVPYALESQRAARLEYVNPVTGSRYSVNAGLCGTTAPSTGTFTAGTVIGYAAGKRNCETTCASPTAHQCTSEEMVRYVATGGDTPAIGYAWIASGGDSRVGSGGSLARDCEGHTSASPSVYGTVWDPNIERADLFTCNNSIMTLCCD